MSNDMDFRRIGPAIRELRIAKGITQKDLSEGICSKNYLSRLESGKVYALWDKLFLLSERLGVDISYFSEIAKYPETDFASTVKQSIRETLKKNDYKTLLKMIKLYKKHPTFSKSNNNLQFLGWHESICISQLDQDFEAARELLQHSLKLTYTPPKYVTEQELAIMNSIGVICFETAQYQLAIDTYLNALKEIRHLRTPIDKKVEIRIIYNLAKALGMTSNFKESTTYCQHGINVCKKSSYNYLLGNLYYLIGYNAFHEGNYQIAKENIEISIQLFRLYDDDYLTKALESLKEIEQKLLQPQG
ncbi:helix-turn-helix transcriptional regulator [Bacillus sp. BGMRC 2118]|nr:helix-turn-helix transcriptional regulator [Bacillus sp. BGMRC 2118]